ncbi:hypothetical protein EV175_006009, partial [Coemansia sp. RSA 1933]
YLADEKLANVPMNLLDQIFGSNHMSAERFKLCLTFHNNLAASTATIPSMATCRGYEFAAPNPDVATLNEVEQHLVVARHPFQAIWPVHSATGQLRAMGPVINVLVSPGETTESVFVTTHQQPGADDGADPGTTAQASDHAIDIGEASAIDEGLDIDGLMDNIKILVVSGDEDLMAQLPRNAADDGRAYGVSVAPAEDHRSLAFAYGPDALALTFLTIFFENNILAIEGNDEHTFTRVCKFIIGNCDARDRRNPKLLLYLNFLKQLVQLHNSMHIGMRSRNAGNNGRLIQARDLRSADFVP